MTLYETHLINTYNKWKSRLDSTKPHSRDRIICEWELKKINNDILELNSKDVERELINGLV